MPKSNEKYPNPQKGFTSLESHIVIRKKLKSKDLTKKVRKVLTKEVYHLLNLLHSADMMAS